MSSPDSRAPEVVFDELTRRDAARCAQLEALLFAGDDPWPEVAFVRELAARHNRYVAARHLPHPQ